MLAKAFFKNWFSSPLRLRLSLLLLVCILFSGFLFVLSRLNRKDARLIAGIKENYVAVPPFKNNTGQEEMSVIGEMAADWITSGLNETGEGKILSVEEGGRLLNNNWQQASASDQEPDDQVNLHYIIDGSYYILHDSLWFSAHIKELNTGEVAFSFPIIHGPRDKPLQSIEQLKQRILGYWVTKDLTGYERKPPLYEAYKIYLEGGKIWHDDPQRAKELMQKAANLDSNFHYAFFGYAHKLLSEGKMQMVDSLIWAYQSRKPEFNAIEREFLAGLQARLNQDYDRLWEHWNNPQILAYWGRDFVIKQQVDDLVEHFNQPWMALDRLKVIDFDQIDFEEKYFYKPLYFKKIDALYRMGSYDEVAAMLEHIPFETHNYSAIKKLYMLEKIRHDSLFNQELARELAFATKVTFPKHYFRAFALLIQLVLHEGIELENEIHAYLEFLESGVQDSLADQIDFFLPEFQAGLYLAIDETGKAQPLLDSLHTLFPDNPDLWVLQAIAHIQLHEEAQARAILDKLADGKEPYDYGYTEMLQGIIYTWLGEEDAAITSLVQARKLGMGLSFYRFDGDWRLKKLFDHPEFEKQVMASFPVPELPVPGRYGSTWAYVLVIGSILLLGIFIMGFWFRSISKTETAHLQKPAPGSLLPQPESGFLAEMHASLLSHLSDSEFGIPQLCESMGISRAQLYRKVKEATDHSPSHYIRRLRLQKARELLQSSDLNISEIAYEVGFKDLSYFSRSFSQEYGFSPSEARN